MAVSGIFYVILLLYYFCSNILFLAVLYKTMETILRTWILRMVQFTHHLDLSL